MGRSSGLYDHLPIPVQTLVVTGYGMVLHRRRYGAEHRRWLARLLKSQWLSGEVVRSQQLQALRRVVDDAFVHVPYYREAYARAGYQVGALQKTEDLSALPIVDKEEVRRDPRAFISERFPARALYERTIKGAAGVEAAGPNRCANEVDDREAASPGAAGSLVARGRRHSVQPAAVAPARWQRPRTA